ncbi:DNA-directed RNA polymerase I subunit RPA34 isoform X1 [Microcaecilia unicolor]|uniref:DNA-directed RNA polymerase I subunit RPA34 isoform X1 n=1 Tax=Microcaecilia unicolor TaxID=1415580 RepID=A0A6P7Z7A9_9AMPH|nr:DNA-directed RNA polymerase I subunit RPA34 isoform X1 [Microcaecilia unicolor]
MFEKEMKFKRPADFIACSLEPVPSFMQNKLCSSSTELWLIKAPVDFNPECFNSRKVPLCGFQTVKSKKDGASRLYSIFSSTRDMGSSYLLAPSSEEGRLACGPALCGYLNVCDSFSGPTGNSPPKAIAAIPAPKIPEGLKQRFQPFGATPLDSGSQRKCQLKKSSKRRKVLMVEADEEISKIKKEREERADKCMGRARQLDSVKQEPVEGEECCEAQILSMDTTDAKKKKKKREWAGDLEHHHKKKTRKRKPIEEDFVLVAEEESSGFQEKTEKVFLGKVSELTVNKAAKEQKNKKSKCGLSDSFASTAEEQSSGFNGKIEFEFLEDSLVPRAEEHRYGNKKKKK